MPNVKQGGGYTLTFAKKNQDVKEHLDKLKKEKVTITDYLCEAVRFYEKNKDKNKSEINPKILEKMIEDKIKLLINSNDITTNAEKSSVYNIEDNIDNVSDDDLEDD